MEKERYMLIDEFAESPFDHDEADLIVDTDTKNVYGANNCGDLCDLLNQQDAKIKELESQVEKWKQDYENCSKLEKNLSKEHQYCLDNWRECEKENQQLKEKIKQLKFDCAMYKSANHLINDVGIGKAREIMFQSEQQLKQSQNQKAIEVLEDIRKTIRYSIEICGGKATDFDIVSANAYNLCLDDMHKILDNQIKNLKEGK